MNTRPAEIAAAPNELIFPPNGFSAAEIIDAAKEPEERALFLISKQPNRAESGLFKVPLTEDGIVIPPNTELGCIGENCKFCNHSTECKITQHHLHSTEPSYDASGAVAKEFRNLNVLTVLLHACRHNIYHNLHEIEVPVPSLEIMREVIEEEKKLRKVIDSKADLRSIDAYLQRPDTSNREKNALNRRKAEIHNKRPEALEGLREIKIIPAELVTGSLLIAAPKIARARIRRGERVVLTGTINKKDASEAQGIALRALGQAA